MPDNGLAPAAAAIKRCVDVSAALAGLLLTGWIIGLAWILIRWQTGEPGFFRQARIGRHGRPFNVVKLRTMRSVPGGATMVTTSADARITPIGRLLRRTKVDELPQLFNVLVGDMSLVGPRPDVAGFADSLMGADRVILSIRPGITGPATLKYRNEEEILARVPDPEAYNRDVIWPDKVRINRHYVEHYRLRDDFRYLWQTIFGGGQVS